MATYKSVLLPISETFILEQTAAFKRWMPKLFGLFNYKNGLNLTSVDHLILRPSRLNLWLKLLDRITGPQVLKLKLTRVIADYKPQLIHIHFGTELYQNWDNFFKLGVPIVTTLHGKDITVRSDVWKSGAYGRSMMGYPEGLLRIASHPRTSFIAVSHSIRDAAIEFGIPSEKIIMRHIGIDTNKFTPPSQKEIRKSLLILFVGRMVEKKGVPYLIQAMKIIQDLRPDVMLVLIGDGPCLGACKALAKRLRVHADFIGAQPPEIVLEWMRRSRVLCLPSVTASDGDAEGFGMVILEAQACGIPVITSAKGGKDEGIQDGITGIAHAERDVKGLAKALHMLLEDDLLWNHMANSARQRMVDHFDLINCTRFLEERFDELTTQFPHVQSK